MANAAHIASFTGGASHLARRAAERVEPGRTDHQAEPEPDMVADAEEEQTLAKVAQAVEPG